MPNIITNQRYFKRYPFEGTSLPAGWGVSALGTGMAVAVAGGAMTITTGTTASAITRVACSISLIPRCRIRFIAKLSQRIANQTFYLEVRNAAGTTYARYKFTGTTNTVCAVESAYAGVANTGKSPGTIGATSTSNLYDIRLDMDRAIYSIIAADAASIMSPSVVFDRNVPANEDELYIEIRAENGGTAPASTTTLTIESVMISDMENVAVEIVPGQAIQNSATAVPIVSTGGSVSVSGSVTNTPVTSSASTIVAAASTNATVVKASAGTLFNMNISNEHTAAQHVKIYNKATAPTVGTDQPVLTIPVPASSNVQIHFGAVGLRLSAGIGLAITALMPYTDTGVATVNGVRCCTEFV